MAWFYLKGENGYVHSGLEYSVNFGEWKEYSGRSVAFGGKYGNLRLRGTNENGTAESATKYARISISQKGNVKCTGDIRTLLNYKITRMLIQAMPVSAICLTSVMY